ncbi:MAG: flippase-like domain-containing protein [Desulfobacteraceae bacterium]|nr:flippase-like domain-containing protein [Desulfobacteraceae bacterium]
MKSNRKKLLKVVIGILLLGVLLFWTDIEQFKEAAKGAEYRYFFYALLLVFCNRILMPIKWNFLLKAINIKIGWFESVKIYFISSFLGVFLPPTVGGDAVRVYHIHKLKHPLKDIISSIIIERVIGLISLLLFAMAGCLLFVYTVTAIEIDFARLLTILIFTCLILTGIFIFSLNRGVVDSIGRFLVKLNHIKILGRAAGIVKRLLDSYIVYANRKRTLLLFFLLTLAEVALMVVRSYLIALAFNINVSLVYFFAFVPIILLLTRLPISFDGFGIHEGGFIYFLSFFGISATFSFSVGIVNHFIGLIAISSGAIFYVMSGFKKEQYEYVSPT